MFLKGKVENLGLQPRRIRLNKKKSITKSVVEHSLRKQKKLVFSRKKKEFPLAQSSYFLEFSYVIILGNSDIEKIWRDYSLIYKLLHKCCL